MRFAVSRLHGGLQLEQAAAQLAAVLGARLGVSIDVRVLDDYARLLDAVLDGEAEVAWLPPFTLARATTRGAEVAALCERKGRLVYRSALVVHVASPIRSVEDLRGARAAWTNASSAAGYVVPRAYLRERGVDPDELALEELHGSNAAACGAVYGGDADVAACYVSEAAADDLAVAQQEIEATLGPEMGRRLRPIGVTPPIPADGIVLAASVPPAERIRARAALLDLHAAPEGADALRALMQADRLVPVTDAVMRMFGRLSQLATGRDEDVTMG